MLNICRYLSLRDISFEARSTTPGLLLLLAVVPVLLLVVLLMVLLLLLLVLAMFPLLVLPLVAPLFIVRWCEGHVRPTTDYCLLPAFRAEEQGEKLGLYRELQGLKVDGKKC